MDKVTGVVLAGGKSTRMGTDKTRLTLGNKSFLQTAVQKLMDICDTVIIVSNKSTLKRKVPSNVKVVRDLEKNIGPMMGILTGLTQISTNSALVLACDVPLVSPRVLLYLKETGGGNDIVVPRWYGRIEPLVGIYTKACIQPIQESIKNKCLSLVDFINQCHLKIHFIDEGRLVQFGNPHIVFHNVNTKEDLRAARRFMISG